jgi:hypothetical protein
MTKLELKTNLAAFMAAKRAACEALDDDTAALNCTKIFPKMQYDGTLIHAGDRLQYNGKLYRASIDLWDREEFNPDNASTLWTEIIYTGGVREVKENMSAAEAFEENERGRWKGKVYVSLISGNVWTPEVLPTGWRLEE